MWLRFPEQYHGACSNLSFGFMACKYAPLLRFSKTRCHQTNGEPKASRGLVIYNQGGLVSIIKCCSGKILTFPSSTKGAWNLKIVLSAPRYILDCLFTKVYWFVSWINGKTELHKPCARMRSIHKLNLRWKKPKQRSGGRAIQTKVNDNLRERTHKIKITGFVELMLEFEQKRLHFTFYGNVWHDTGQPC